VAFIDEHRDRFGVEPICRVLTEHGCKVAPNTYWTAKKRPSSARTVRDEYLKGEIARVWQENMGGVYGADKVWAQLNREGTRVARCTVERLMRELGLSGARRGKAFKVTTRSDDRQHRPADLVKRDFRAPAPPPDQHRFSSGPGRDHYRSDTSGHQRIRFDTAYDTL
jgi:putative transposase